MTEPKTKVSPGDTSFSRPAWLLQLNSFGEKLASGPESLIPLDVQSLLDAACNATGLNDFGSSDFSEPLEVLVHSLETEADLTPMGRMLARGDLSNLLENRLQVVEAHRAHPEIGKQLIEKPVFIVGLPRSGTSILHELLAQDPRLRAPLSWEAHSPWPAPGAEPEGETARIERAESVFTFWNELVPEYRTMHEMGARIPCECIWLTAHSFRSEEFLGRNQVPSYGGWLATADLAPAYAIHRKILELLQWKKPTPRWLLKAPSHMMA
ncbi:MAG: sulfotransferase, partial [Myxococcota bacterium]